MDSTVERLMTHNENFKRKLWEYVESPEFQKNGQLRAELIEIMSYVLGKTTMSDCDKYGRDTFALIQMLFIDMELKMTIFCGKKSRYIEMPPTKTAKNKAFSAWHSPPFVVPRE